MFDKEFYPTPPHLIEQLLKPFQTVLEEDKRFTSYLGKYRIQGSILEPSAGKGDILDYIKEHTNNNNETFAIEKNVELQQVLRSKKYQVIESDFLNYDEEEFFDFIIMNPPFSNGDEHLLKAIEIAQKTKIACILNAQTIKNPNTKKRKKLLSIIEEFGTYEFVQNGFSDAQRKTDVEVVLIWLDIKKENTRFDFDFVSMDEIKVDFDFDIHNNSVAKADMIGNLKLRYAEVQKAYEEKLKADQKYKYYLDAFLGGEGYSIKGDIEKKSGNPQQKYSYLSRVLKRFMWKSTISKLGIKKYMSSNVLKNFNQFISEQSNMAFNKENVFSFFDFIMNNRITIIEKAIVEVFEDITSRGYEENRMFVETWKTNNAYKVNRKIIAPAYVKYGSYMCSSSLKEYGDKFSLGYNSWSNSKLSDLDKVLQYISGKKDSEVCTIKEAIEKQFDVIGKIRTGDKFNSNTQSTFFDIKFYKKGTIHLKFRDEKLWKEFNYRACDGKNWLPNNEKKDWKEPTTKKEKTPTPTPKNKESKPKKVRKLNSEFSQQLLELFG
jgi:23S rRNA A1618 N6-methylase RlmF